MPRTLVGFAALLLATLVATSSPADDASDDLYALSRAALIGAPDEKTAALDRLVARGERDIIPSLVLIMRIGGEDVRVAAALSRLAGAELRTWRDAMLWQEAHPEIVPHPSFERLMFWHLNGLDPRFLDFFEAGAGRETRRIRLEEIAWGGVAVDGIPSLDDPEMIPADAAGYLFDDDLVFGVEIDGDARAYPLRIMNWHEMANDVVGGVPVALAYCTLCGAGILFETAVAGRDAPFVFGSSGLLYRSNKLMFDRETGSLWNQFTGEPVIGPLARSGLALTIRPLAITSWAEWRARHPETRVLSLDTGFIRDYDPGVAYRDYFASPDLMFPTQVAPSDLAAKDIVFGVRAAGGAKAWPIAIFSETPLINDVVGLTDVVVIGDADTRTARAYERRGETFSLGGDGRLTSPAGDWRIEETALVGPDGQGLPRLPGHLAYWFAWDRFLGEAR